MGEFVKSVAQESLPAKIQRGFVRQGLTGPIPVLLRIFLVFHVYSIMHH